MEYQTLRADNLEQKLARSEKLLKEKDREINRLKALQNTMFTWEQLDALRRKASDLAEGLGLYVDY